MAEKPPLTIRLGTERQGRADEHMVRTGLALRAAVLDLVDLGLDVAEEESGPPKKSNGGAKVARAKAALVSAERRVGVEPARHVDVQVGPTRPPFGSLLKGSKR